MPEKKRRIGEPTGSAPGHLWGVRLMITRRKVNEPGPVRVELAGLRARRLARRFYLEQITKALYHVILEAGALGRGNGAVR